MLVAFNKMDLPAAARGLAGVRARPRRPTGSTSWPSPRDRRGPRRVPGPRSPSCCPMPPELAEPPEPAGVVVHRIEAMGDGFTVEREEDGVFRVRGQRIERIAAQTNFDVEESAERFQRDLARLGIDAELRRAGIATGRPRPDRRRRARVGAATLGASGDGRDPTVRRPRSASSAARSTRSTSPTSRSPRRRARPSASSACCSSRPASRRTSRARSSPRPRTAWRWSSWRSPATRRSR